MTTIAVPVNTCVELDPDGWEPLPDLPAALLPVRVGFSYSDTGKLETEVTLTIDGSEETAVFWNTDLDGVVNNAEDFGAPDAPWSSLNGEPLDAAAEYGRQIHHRICDAIELIIGQVAPHGSPLYAAALAYAASPAV